MRLDELDVFQPRVVLARLPISNVVKIECRELEGRDIINMVTNIEGLR